MSFALLSHISFSYSYCNVSIICNSEAELVRYVCFRSVRLHGQYDSAGCVGFFAQKLSMVLESVIFTMISRFVWMIDGFEWMVSLVQ